MHLDSEKCARKIEYIKKCFTTQANKNWFTDDAFYSLPRLRGIECDAPGKYAEAFYCRKMVV